MAVPFAQAPGPGLGGDALVLWADVGQTRKLAWACRPQSAALVARLADPDRGWDAIVIGE
jgi:site-specific DNA recombinase